MKRQRGAALVVVLSLLTMSLMLGLSGMQSSILDERLAGNYKATTEAQMNAELGASEFMAWLKSEGWPTTSSEEESWDGHAALAAAGNRYEVIEPVIWGASSVEVRVQGLSGQQSRAFLDTVFARVPPDFIKANGAYTCYGTNCSVSTGSGQASSSINGRDHIVGEAGCSIKGSNTPEINTSGQDRAGLIIPDGIYSEGGKGDNIDGDPPVVSSESGYEELAYAEDLTISEAEAELDQFIDDLLSGGKVAMNPGQVSGLSNIAYAGVNETIEINSDSGGIIILEGGTLEFKQGNACFAGLVIARQGIDGSDSQVVVPPTIDGKGTSAIVGAVIGKSMEYTGNGTPSVYYSSMALDFFAGGSIGDSISITTWQND
ncbi:pilus assembly PilX family protein [Billgrantia montanilacus]|nr:PilX N-terminal domain-containing pilus assembly protein [Halomonas montanilacus]